MLATLMLMLAVAQPPFVEDFDSVGGLIDRGWTLRNNSNPNLNVFPTWFRGPLPYWHAQPRFSQPFTAHQGDYYLVGNFRCCSVGGTSGTGTLSLWAITPAIQLNNRTMTFWARRTNEPFFPDRLQVRLGASTADPGTTAEGVGGFETVLLDVPNLPSEWTQYTIHFVSDRASARIMGRVAFRYYSPNAGPDGFNSDYIGIDTLRIE